MRLEESRYKRIDHPIPPLYDKDSRILILGSFPSVKSREAAFFYGHPQNRFWKTMAGVLSSKVPETVEEKSDFLHRNHVALWDVIASCDIVGSSDSSIRNVVANDLAPILSHAHIRQIFCNGAKSYEYYCRYLREQTGMDAKKLPSTSPANAAFSLDRLVSEWQAICQPLKAAPAGIGRILLNWYDYNARILPWRSEPSPYHVWISEIMLQQTRVEAVRAYYDRWMRELPDVESLAMVSEERLLKLWEGLGYYNRARNLKAAAMDIMEHYEGQLPADYDKLLKLKGIGEYTAGAIASIAYGLPRAAIDGNVLRVFARLLGESGEISQTDVKRSIKEEVLRVMPEDRPGDFNQALMDLGAVICLPNGQPDCENCPWESVCLAHSLGKETDYPVKKKKKARRIEHKAVFIIMIADREADDSAGEKSCLNKKPDTLDSETLHSDRTRNNPPGKSLILHKRSSKGLLPDLWEFPNVEGDFSLEEAREKAVSWGLTDFDIEQMGEGKHIFSHVEWQMKGYLVKVKTVPDTLMRQESWVKVPRDTASSEYAIPAAFEVYKKQVLE